MQNLATDLAGAINFLSGHDFAPPRVGIVPGTGLPALTELSVSLTGTGDGGRRRGLFFHSGC